MTSITDQWLDLTPEQRQALQQRIEQDNAKQDISNILLPLQEGDITTKKPLFCIHPLLGAAGYYLNIVRHLPSDQPVYGIQSPALVGIRPAFDDIPAMASYYLEAIATIDATPPQMLLGHSSGCYIAYEMALQLQRRGQPVPVLAFIDQAAPIGPITSQTMQRFRTLDHLNQSDEALFMTAWLVGKIHGQVMDISFDTFKALSSWDEKYDMVADFFQQAGFLPQSAGHEMVKTMLATLASHIHADFNYHETHTPDGPDIKYQGHTLLFQCTKETLWQGLGKTAPPDLSTTSNWDQCCEGPIDVIGVPDADHISIALAEPCVKAIAQRLQEHLERVAMIA